MKAQVFGPALFSMWNHTCPHEPRFFGVVQTTDKQLREFGTDLVPVPNLDAMARNALELRDAAMSAVHSAALVLEHELGIEGTQPCSLARYLRDICRAPVTELLHEVLVDNDYDAPRALRAIFGGEIPRVVQGARL